MPDTFPPVPQTGRKLPTLPSDRQRELLKLRMASDKTDLFASDADEAIRTLGKIALRRGKLLPDDSFALGDLCAQRSLTGDRLLVLYIGKTLAAYRRAAQAGAASDKEIAAQAAETYVRWLVTVAERVSSPRNVAAALWALAEWQSEMPSGEVLPLFADVLQGLSTHFASPSEQSVSAPPITEGDQPLPAPDAEETRPDLASAEVQATLSETFDGEAEADRESILGTAFAAELPPDERATMPPVDPMPAIEVPVVRFSSNTDEYAPGQRIGPDSDPDRYEVYRVLHGGMSVVYLAYDRAEHRSVALKTTKPRLDSKAEHALRQRFIFEAHTWVRLEKHPHVVQALIVQTIGDRPYLALEYIGGAEGVGSDLRGWIEHRRLDVPMALEIALHVCRAMQHATTKVPGLVHRDLKPENVLVTPDGVAKVTDFGLALALPDAPSERDESPLSENEPEELQSNRRLTRAGLILGTAGYLSPEQCRAEPLDLRSDVYALGVILYEMLTGRPLYQAQTFKAWVQAHLTGTPAFPGDTSVPDPIRELTLRALSRDRDHRPTDWNMLAAELTALYQSLTGQPIAAGAEGAALQMRELMDNGYSLSEIGHHDEALQAYDRALALGPESHDAAWVWARRGRTLRILQRYNEALQSFDRALAIHPRYAWALNQRGIVLSLLNRREDARRAFQQASDRHPGDPWPILNQADLLEKDGRYTEALAVLDRVLAFDPNHARTHAKRGYLLRKTGDYTGALAAYDRALNYIPNDTWAWYGKGVALQALERLEEAISAYAQAARVDRTNENEWAWYAQAEALDEVGRTVEALGAAQQSTRLHPGHITSWLMQGRLLLKLNRYDDALHTYEQALGLDVKNAEVWAEKARTLAAHGDWEMALAAYQTAIKYDPNNASYLYDQANLLHDMGHPADALKLLAEAIALNPNDARFHAKQGQLFRILKQYEEVIAACDRALAINPRYAWPMMNKGLALQAMGKHDKAVEIFATAAKEQPDNVWAWYDRAYSLVALNRSAEALSVLDRALRLDSQHFESWAKRGQALYALGRYKEALAAFDNALKIRPENAWIWKERSTALEQMGRIEEALAGYERAASLEPAVSVYWTRQITLLLNRGHLDEALVVSEQACVASSNDSTIWAQRGQVLRRLDRHPEALDAYDKALLLSPRYAWAWNGKGLSFLTMNRPADALVCFERATIYDDKDVWFWHNRGKALFELKRFDEATTMLRRALDIDRGHEASRNLYDEARRKRDGEE